MRYLRCAVTPPGAWAQASADTKLPRICLKRSVRNSTPALKRLRSSGSFSTCATRASARSSLQSMRTTWFSCKRTVGRERHAVQRQVAHLAVQRRLLRPRHQDLDCALFRDAIEHALAGVFEPMALGGIQRTRALAAFVVALEHAREAVRGAAEETVVRAARAGRVRGIVVARAVCAMRSRS